MREAGSVPPRNGRHAGEEGDLHFLRHAALRGGRRIHPRGRGGTRGLVRALGLSGGERVLEIGCGTGQTLLDVAGRHRVRLEGVDLLPEMLEAARQRVRWAGLGERVRLLRARGDQLPLAGGAYERVYLESVLAIQPRARALALLRETSHVLKPAGLLVANEAVWRVGVSRREAEAINALCVRHFGVPQSSSEPWSADDWAREMEVLGFQVVSAGALLDDAREPGGPWGLRAGLASSGVNLWLLLKALASPGYLARWRAYRARLAEVAGLGGAVEARLFVLRKPD